MFLKSDKGIEVCREAFHSLRRSEQIYGYVGEIRKSGRFSFYITNRKVFFRNTREMRGGRMLISVFAYGKVQASSDGADMEVRFLYGMSIWELLLLYAGTFVIMYIAITRYNDISPLLVAACALIYTLGFELYSIVCSGLTLLGRDDRRELEEFLTGIMEKEEL